MNIIDSLQGKVLLNMKTLGSIFIVAEEVDHYTAFTFHEHASISTSQLFDQLNLVISKQCSEADIFRGGEFNANNGFVLHDNSWLSSRSKRLMNSSLYYSETLDILKAISRDEGPDIYKLFLGYTKISKLNATKLLKSEPYIVEPLTPKIIQMSSPDEVADYIIYKNDCLHMTNVVGRA